MDKWNKVPALRQPKGTAGGEHVHRKKTTPCAKWDKASVKGTREINQGATAYA